MSQNETTWLLSLLNSSGINVPASQAEECAACKSWLRQIRDGALEVAEVVPPQTADLKVVERDPEMPPGMP